MPHVIAYCTVVSAEQYAEPPSADLRFPIKDDLINYTKGKDMSEIIIPSTLVREKLEEENDGKCMHENRRYHNYAESYTVYFLKNVACSRIANMFCVQMTLQQWKLRSISIHLRV